MIGRRGRKVLHPLPGIILSGRRRSDEGSRLLRWVRERGTTGRGTADGGHPAVADRAAGGVVRRGRGRAGQRGALAAGGASWGPRGAGGAAGAARAPPL